MECLITGLWRRSPGLNQSISDVVFDGGEPSISQSFGSQLLLDSRYDVIDSDLRKLIAGCQAYCKHTLTLSSAPLHQHALGERWL